MVGHMQQVLHCLRRKVLCKDLKISFTFCWLFVVYLVKSLCTINEAEEAAKEDLLIKHQRNQSGKPPKSQEGKILLSKRQTSQILHFQMISSCTVHRVCIQISK